MKGLQNNYKGQMDNNEWRWKWGREVGRAGTVGGKGRKMYLNNLKKEREKGKPNMLTTHVILKMLYNLPNPEIFSFIKKLMPLIIKKKILCLSHTELTHTLFHAYINACSTFSPG